MGRGGRHGLACSLGIFLHPRLPELVVEGLLQVMRLGLVEQEQVGQPGRLLAGRGSFGRWQY